MHKYAHLTYACDSMQVGKLLEMLGGKAALMNGKFADATAFASTPTSIQAIQDTLTLHGYHFGGKEFLTVKTQTLLNAVCWQDFGRKLHAGFPQDGWRDRKRDRKTRYIYRNQVDA